MAVNHLGHFLLTMLLENTMKATAERYPEADVRIVNVSSDGHKFTMKSGLDIDDPKYVRTVLHIRLTIHPNYYDLYPNSQIY